MVSSEVIGEIVKSFIDGKLKLVQKLKEKIEKELKIDFNN